MLVLVLLSGALLDLGRQLTRFSLDTIPMSLAFYLSWAILTVLWNIKVTSARATIYSTGTVAFSDLSNKIRYFSYKVSVMKSSFLVAFSNEDLHLLLIVHQLATCSKISVLYLCSICLATKNACDFSSSFYPMAEEMYRGRTSPSSETFCQVLYIISICIPLTDAGHRAKPKKAHSFPKKHCKS